MRNRMYFGAHDNAEYGVIVTRLPDIPAAEENGEWVAIPGADGERFVSDGALQSVTMTVPLWIPPTADVNAVTAWLSGAGDLRINDWPWTWRARVEGQINLAPCAFNDGWTASPVFKANPHRYLYPADDAIAIAASGTSLTGKGTAAAKPLVEITGSGDITLMIGDSTMLIDGLDGTLALDCDAKIAYSGAMLKGDLVEIVDGIWPTLQPTATLISWAGSISALKITPRWRYR